jgi:hypothetical protein
MDDETDGWMDGKLHKKRPQRPLLYVMSIMHPQKISSVSGGHLIQPNLSLTKQSGPGKFLENNFLPVPPVWFCPAQRPLPCIIWPLD